MQNKTNLINIFSLVSIFASFIYSGMAQAQNMSYSFPNVDYNPKYETRAVWITTLSGLDWPKTKANSPINRERQKAELCNQLDALKKANFNTILLQVRLRDDVIYPSSQEPFAETLTGTFDKDPGYDPLAFAIKECHKRGMELHAWMVAIPLGSDKQVKQMGKKSLVKKRPDMCIRHNARWYLNPGHPETKTYLTAIAKDIATRYDVDGINLDYIRYPDRPKRFPDQRTYRKYGKGKSLAQWRRDNITEIVSSIYKSVKSIKPWIKIGSSPVGKYNDVARYSSRGWNAHEIVFQDAQRWMKEGIHDIILPMAYFRDENFYPFLLDWQENSNGRTIVPGLGIYFLDPSEGNWTLNDVMQQIHFTRSARFQGQAYFRTQFLLDNQQGLLDKIKTSVYTSPALVPPMTWQDSIPPSMPTGLKVEEKADSIILSWNAVTDDIPFKGYSVSNMRYNIYASKNDIPDIENPRNLKATYVQGTHFAIPISKAKDMHFLVTAVDRYGNESPVTTKHHQHKNNTSRNNIVKLPELPDAYRLTITDLYARIVWEATYTREISVTRFAPGVYYILIYNTKNELIDKKQFIR